MCNTEKEYHVCHDCQKVGMRNCSEFDLCGGGKTYPLELREMIKREYYNKTPLSIIAEKAFDMAKKTVDERHGLIVVSGSESVLAAYWDNKGIKKI